MAKQEKSIGHLLVITEKSDLKLSLEQLASEDWDITIEPKPENLEKYRTPSPELFPYDVVIIDQDSIGNDTSRLIREFRGIDPNLTSIMVGNDESNLESVRGAMRAGFFDYVPRPIISTDFLLSVREGLSRRQQLREQEMNRKPIYDEKTDLFNARYFSINLDEEVARYIRRDLNSPFSIVFADVNYFKIYNDVFGYEFGDEVIKIVGEVFRSQAREMDIPARFGGDEFVTLLKVVGPQGDSTAESYVKRVIAKLKEIDYQQLSQKINLEGAIQALKGLSKEDPEDKAYIIRRAKKFLGLDLEPLINECREIDMEHFNPAIYQHIEEQLKSAIANHMIQISYGYVTFPNEEDKRNILRSGYLNGLKSKKPDQMEDAEIMDSARRISSYLFGKASAIAQEYKRATKKE